MKDFFDVWLLIGSFDFDGRVLAQAINGTFGRRHTTVDLAPICFTPAFSESPVKAVQWNAFVRNSKLDHVPAAFADVVAVVSGFARPVFEAIARGREYQMFWHHPGPWTAA
jgi:hypothetical protein